MCRPEEKDWCKMKPSLCFGSFDAEAWPSQIPSGNFHFVQVFSGWQIAFASKWCTCFLGSELINLNFPILVLLVLLCHMIYLLLLKLWWLQFKTGRKMFLLIYVTALLHNRCMHCPKNGTQCQLVAPPLHLIPNKFYSSIDHIELNCSLTAPSYFLFQINSTLLLTTSN